MSLKRGCLETPENADPLRKLIRKVCESEKQRLVSGTKCLAGVCIALTFCCFALVLTSRSLYAWSACHRSPPPTVTHTALSNSQPEFLSRSYQQPGQRPPARHLRRLGWAGPLWGFVQPSLFESARASVGTKAGRRQKGDCTPALRAAPQQPGLYLVSGNLGRFSLKAGKCLCCLTVSSLHLVGKDLLAAKRQLGKGQSNQGKGLLTLLHREGR